jgi:hypothetical protein
MSVLTASARLRKLRAMTPAEIAERVRYRTVLTLERAMHRRGRLTSTTSLEPVLRRDLRGSGWRARLLASRAKPGARFYAGARERAAVRALFEGPYTQERRAAAVHAARAREHRFEFFGRQFAYEAEIDWQKDPVTGRQWPAAFHADVPVHGGDIGYGDVKYVWELSRQQYLIDLAKGAFIEDSQADRAAMVRLVRSWMAGNPYATGVNWACALEPAFRVWSWLWAYHLTCDALDPDFHVEWLGGFHDHGRFLARHLEQYSSPYNHLIGEASALFALGVLFPEFEAAGAWRRRGRSVLERRLGGQFYGDGGSVEQSTFYHHATTGFYLLAALLGRVNGEELSTGVWAALTRALDFSLALSQPDGRTPEIGGADDGKPIRLEHLPFWDFRPYLAVGAAVLGRADYKAVAGRFYEDALWLLGVGGLAAFEALPSEIPSPLAVLLPSSGYAVDRSEWSAAADYVCFDVGEQAAGMRTDGVPNSMHGHADCLSLVAWLGGRRVLVDAGLFAYNCGGRWEAHFRQTAAHNTAKVDGRDQARHLGKMAWSHSYRPAIAGHYQDRDQAWTLASHDGFARGTQPVIHRRAVWRRPGGYIVVYDEFTGEGVHDLEVNWQFAPGVLESTAVDRALYEGGIHMVWQGSGDWQAEVRCGGDDPADGWICRSLGVREAAPRLTLRRAGASLPARLLTILADGARSVVHVARRAGNAPTVTVLQAGAADVVVAAGVTASDQVETDAVLAICRTAAASASVEAAQIGGTYCRARPAASPLEEAS